MDILIYEPDKATGSSKCIKVGLLGCERIESISEGTDDGGISIYSYIAHYKDGTKVKVANAILALS